jgi:hypothetical protein
MIRHSICAEVAVAVAINGAIFRSKVIVKEGIALWWRGCDDWGSFLSEADGNERRSIETSMGSDTQRPKR